MAQPNRGSDERPSDGTRDSTPSNSVILLKCSPERVGAPAGRSCSPRLPAKWRACFHLQRHSEAAKGGTRGSGSGVELAHCA